MRNIWVLLGLYGLSLFAVPAGAQWLSFTEETGTRLSLSTVSINDDEEKDMAVADLDHDGWDDIVVVRKVPFSNPGARQDVLLMNVNGVLTDMTATFAPGFISEVTDARDVFIADFTGDGWEDVVIANTFHQQPKFYRNLGESGGNWLGLADESGARFPFFAPPGQDPGPGPLFCAVWGGNLGGNSALDLYFSNYNQGGDTATEDVLLINNGAGIFTNETSTRLGTYARSAFGTGVILADMNNDTFTDIVKISTLFAVTPWNDIGIFLLYNDGTGDFNNLSYQQYSAGAPYMLAIGDLNNDGMKDVYTVDDQQDRIHIATSITGGVVSYSNSNTNSTRTLGFGGNVAMADMDGDGDLDVGVSPADVDIENCTGPQAGEFAFLRNNGSGALSDPWNSSNDQNFHLASFDFAFTDIDRDGCLDIFMGLCEGWATFMQEGCAVSVPDVASSGVSLKAAPNPFRTQVTIQQSLATAGVTGDARVDVYDVAGRLVRSVWSGAASEAPGQLVWDGRDNRGARVRPDVYFVRVSFGDRVEDAKVVLIQ